MQAELTYAVVVFVFSLACAEQDIKEKKVPDLVLICAVICGLILRCVFDIQNLCLSVLCGLGAGLFYFIVRLITRGRLGMADVLFGVFQGVILFPVSLFVCVLIECLSAAGWFLILRLRHRDATGEKSGRIAFIPFMAIGLIISYLLSILLFPVIASTVK